MAVYFSGEFTYNKNIGSNNEGGAVLGYLQMDELQTAERFLFLSMAIVVMEQDQSHFRQGGFKIKEPYIGLLEVMAAEAAKERGHLREVMHRKQITVSALHKDHSFSSFLFTCRGREEIRNYFNPAIRKKVETIIKRLMSKAFFPEHSHVSLSPLSVLQEYNEIGQCAESGSSSNRMRHQG